VCGTFFPSGLFNLSMPAYCSAVSNSHLGTASGSAELSNRRAANGVPGPGPFASPKSPTNGRGRILFCLGHKPGVHPAKARRIAANIAKLPELLSGSNVGSVMISKRGQPQAIALGLCFGLVAHQSNRLS